MPVSWVDVDVGGQNMEAYLTRPETEGRYRHCKEADKREVSACTLLLP